MCETWSENIDMNFQNMNMFIDMSAAFDCVSHATLIKKMEMYRFDNRTVELILLYLSYSSQFVEINGQRSEIRWVKYGVYFGSFLFIFILRNWGQLCLRNTNMV